MTPGLLTTPATTHLTWLYVPGSRPDRFDSAAASGADVVVLDWEDSVSLDAKPGARRDTMGWLNGVAGQPAATRPVVEIRINDVRSGLAAEDFAAIGDHPAVSSVRVPKVESPADVALVEAGLRSDRIWLHCLLESAAGIETAAQIASASARVGRIGIGASDLSADLGSGDAALLDWCAVRVVVAARAAGLPRPAMSVYTAFRDSAGLAASCGRGRALGMLGRSAIHPDQIQVIAAAFAPTDAELSAARQLMSDLAASVSAGAGGYATGDGRFVDAAIAAQARAVVDLAERHRRVLPTTET